MTADHVRVVTSAPGRNRLRWTPVPGVTDWESFVDWIVGGGTGGGKYGRPYSPVTLTSAPGRRLNANLAARHVLTLDADDAGADYLDRLAERLRFAGLSHTTANHATEKPRWRTLVPLSRAATPEEAKTLAAHMVGLVGRERFDLQASTSPAAVAYAPAWDGAECKKHDGPVLDVDDWLMVAKPLAWSTTDATGAPTVAEFLDEHPVTDLADLPGCHYGRATLDGVAADLEGTAEGDGVHPAIFHAACRGVEMVRAGCWSVRDLDRLQDTAALLRADPRPHEWDEALAGALAKGCERDTGCGEHAPDLFDATRVLRHVRQAAHSRWVSDRGLLVYLLARLAVEVPSGTKLPETVGSRASLNLGAAVVGKSGDGKSVLFDVSRELLGLVQQDVEKVPGSGEGLIQSFLDSQQNLIAHPVRLFSVDEIGQLGAVKDNRSGSTLGPILRSMLTGGLLGTENADKARRRHVPGGTYRAVLLAGVQPEASDVLLNAYDAGVGTPQRFVWVPTLDPALYTLAVAPAWPGPLGWEPPTRWPDVIDYPEHVKAAVRSIAREKHNPDGAADALDGHAMLTRLKVAALLAVLHGETAITDQWWDLSGAVERWSRETIAACRRTLGERGARKDEEQGKAAGRRRLAEEAVVSEDRTRRESVTRTLLDKAEDAGDDGLAWSALRNKVRSDRRAVADGLVGTPDEPGPLVDSGQLRLAVVVYQGTEGARVYRGGRP